MVHVGHHFGSVLRTQGTLIATTRLNIIDFVANNLLGKLWFWTRDSQRILRKLMVAKSDGFGYLQLQNGSRFLSTSYLKAALENFHHIRSEPSPGGILSVPSVTEPSFKKLTFVFLASIQLDRLTAGEKMFLSSSSISYVICTSTRARERHTQTQQWNKTTKSWKQKTNPWKTIHAQPPNWIWNWLGTNIDMRHACHLYAYICGIL